MAWIIEDVRNVPWIWSSRYISERIRRRERGLVVDFVSFLFPSSFFYLFPPLFHSQSSDIWRRNISCFHFLPFLCPPDWISSLVAQLPPFESIACITRKLRYNTFLLPRWISQTFILKLHIKNCTSLSPVSCRVSVTPSLQHWKAEWKVLLILLKIFDVEQDKHLSSSSFSEQRGSEQ